MNSSLRISKQDPYYDARGVLFVKTYLTSTDKQTQDLQLPGIIFSTTWED